MNRLFWRIFGSFWLLLCAFAVVTFAINFTFIGPVGNPHGQPDPPFGGPFDDVLGFLMMRHGPPPGGMPNHDPDQGIHQNGPNGDSLLLDVEKIVNTRNMDDVRRYFTALYHQRGASFYLFDSKGHIVCGASPPPPISILVEQTLRTNHFQMTFDHNAIVHASLIKAENHRTYVLVDSLTPPPPDWTAIALRITLALLTASLICWWLTVQITQPLHILRSATQEVAAGRFTTRTTPLLRGRKDELGMLGRDFDMMSDKLENLISAHTRLMADISHELRSPLARLTLASAVARRTYDTEGHLSLDRVDRETERMTELVSQLTSLSQLDLASAELSCESVDINELVDSIAESTAFEAREKNCTLVKSNDNTTEIFVEGDRELLRRMVENVVRNATRYTMPNTRIDVRVNTIDSGKNVRIMVLDRGPGVPNNELEEIFRPFYRTSLARDRQSGGVGLGLAIAQRAAAKHDGTISASNRTDGNGGLSVCITLPCVTFAC